MHIDTEAKSLASIEILIGPTRTAQILGVPRCHNLVAAEALYSTTQLPRVPLHQHVTEVSASEGWMILRSFLLEQENIQQTLYDRRVLFPLFIRLDT
jgi:hypothetical protein